MNDTISSLDSALPYDPDAPLRPEIERSEDELTVSISHIRYYGIRRQRVTGLLVEPAEEGPFPALVFLHPFYSDKMFFLSEAKTLADRGFVSLLIEAPHKRPEPHRIPFPLSDPKDLRAYYLQIIGDTRRGYDLLAQMDAVDVGTLGFVGQHEGGSLGPAISALEPRVTAVVCIAPIPRQSAYWSESNDAPARERRRGLGGLQLRRLQQALEEFDVTPLLGRARAESWLFQFARDDERFAASELDALKRGLRKDTEIRFYEDGRMESVTPATDRLRWLEKALKRR